MVIVMLAAELGGCTSWGPPRVGVVEPQGRRLQVWQSGRPFALDRAVVSEDSIVGRAAYGEPHRGARVAIARAGVDSVRVRRTSAGKTMLATVGALTVAAGAAIGIAFATMDWE
jgi:hypothetical protein